MKRTTPIRFGKLAALLGAASMLMLSGCFFTTTGPNEVGVKVWKWPVKKVVETPYESGVTHFYLPLLNEFYLFSTKLQNMEMTYDPSRGDVRARDDLLFKTIDGNDISLDVIISWRIIPEKAPYVLQFVARNNEGIKDSIVRTVVRSRPRDIFGELKTEDFYVADKREEKALNAKKILNEILNPFGIVVERVSTKDYRFNEAYQKAIEDKKVADQLVEKNRSAAKAVIEEYLKKLADAQGEVNQMVAEADGMYKQAVIEADAYYEKQSMIAEAITAEGEAEAKGITELNKALAGKGGEILAKLELARALKGKKILLLPVSEGGMNLKKTDINQLLEIYGAERLADEAAKPKRAGKK